MKEEQKNIFTFEIKKTITERCSIVATSEEEARKLSSYWTVMWKVINMDIDSNECVDVEDMTDYPNAVIGYVVPRQHPVRRTN